MNIRNLFRFLSPRPKHIWVHAGDDFEGTRSCSVCGRTERGEADDWGVVWHNQNAGDPAKHTPS